MRVLHVLHNSLPLLCGYSIRSGYIVREQRAQGIEPFVVTSAQNPNPNGDALRDEVDGVLHLRTPADKGRQWPLVREWRMMESLRGRIEHAIRETRPDVVHAHSPVLVGLPALRTAHDRGIPCVYEIRDLWENASVDRGKFGYNSPQYLLARALETYVLTHADAVVTICQTLRQELASRIPDPSRLFVVDNGVDVTAFRPRTPAPDEARRWHLDGKQILAYVGTFQPYEGLGLLIEAMPIILRGVPHAHLLVAGGSAGASTELETSLRQQVARLGLESAVTFTGRLPHDEVEQVYRLADLLIYPRVATRTTALTTPLKPLEAMAMGKAVICSDLPALRELVIDGQTGLLFQSGDRDSLARQSLAVLGSRELRDTLGGHARRWVVATRQWPSLVERYQSIYAQVAAGGSVFTADAGNAAQDDVLETAIAS